MNLEHSCGILCATCPLGSGAAADSAANARKHISECQIPMRSPSVPGGEAIDWKAVDRALDWMITYARCAGLPASDWLHISRLKMGLDPHPLWLSRR